MQSDPHRTFMLGSRGYDLVKKLVQVVLPAVASSYFSLAGIWDLPEPEKVVGTIAIVTTFLGIALGISTAQYRSSDQAFGGQINITPQPDGPTRFDLVVDGDPMNIVDKKQITFKINTDTTVVANELLSAAELNDDDLDLEKSIETLKAVPKKRTKKPL